MSKKEQKERTSSLKPRKSLVDLLTYAYIRKIKKLMFCPACRNGKMAINRSSTHWQCEECGYQLSADEFEDDYVFWFCDECDAYLNTQEGFSRKATKHICQKCGYENDTTFDNIKGICSDCGKTTPDPEATLCVDCKVIRKEKAKKWLATAGVIAAGVVLAVVASSDDENTSEISNPISLPDTDDSDNNDDEVYGLGPGLYPTCNACGSLMTQFDDWAWYTCPVCGNRVRIIGDKVTWYEDIFGTGKKQHYSDYELADFCHGGDLSED